MDRDKVIIGCDHAGYALKLGVVSYLRDGGRPFTDCGTYSEEPVDYPDVAAALAARVSSGEFRRGILICGSGAGMAIVANKFPGVRAVVCWDEEAARLSRRHNDANILVLAGRRTGIEEARAVVHVWLEETFLGGRHQRRLDKIGALEEELRGCGASLRAAD
jgi:ribose 5-phosphate isomerase B